MHRSETEKDAIIAFIDSHTGGAIAFNFTLEDGASPIKVCVNSDTISVTKVNPNIYNVELEIIELV